jgi:hypothetical protein
LRGPGRSATCPLPLVSDKEICGRDRGELTPQDQEVRLAQPLDRYG